jgi:2-dehydro-3-deoxyphosphooctonate aldolase (KDO 8-P synthase)
MTKYKFIAGPCAIESIDSFVRFAEVLSDLFVGFPQFELIYKGSFDKANRTLPGSPRGIGLVEAQVAWRQLRSEFPTLRLTTDIHETWQAREVDVDVIQIPAFLGKQTPLIAAAGETGKVVNLKKPQWLGPEHFESAETKARYAKEVWFTHRGNGNSAEVPVLDLEFMAGNWQNQSILDLTHTNGPSPVLASARSRALAVAAAAVGIQNFFAETHWAPREAICDANHQISVTALKRILTDLSFFLP